jgi:hypothetical protein
MGFGVDAYACLSGSAHMINRDERVRVFRYLLQNRVFFQAGIFLFEIFDFYGCIKLHHLFFAGIRQVRPDR